jgi:hypothetical protein
MRIRRKICQSHKLEQNELEFKHVLNGKQIPTGLLRSITELFMSFRGKSNNIELHVTD